METKPNILRDALAQAPGTRLPEGFTQRLMQKVHRESARQERRETHLLIAAVVGCAAILIGGVIFLFGTELSTVLQRLGSFGIASNGDPVQWPALPDISRSFDISAYRSSGETCGSLSFYIFIALTFLGLSGLSLYLQRRFNAREQK